MFRSIVSSSINVIIKSRRISTLTVHAPAATAKRSLALPIVFLSVQHWDYALPPPAAAAISSEGKPVRQGDADGANKYAGWIESFNAKGYTCLNLLVDPSTCTATAPTAILSLLESGSIITLHSVSLVFVSKRLKVMLMDRTTISSPHFFFPLSTLINRFISFNFTSPDVCLLASADGTFTHRPDSSSVDAVEHLCSPPFTTA